MDERRRELFGYGVWGVVAIVVAVPELWAAVSGDAADWPTVSGTVGYLEYWHPWVAVVVIGMLVWAAFHVVRYEAQRVAAQPAAADPSLYRTPGGRWSARRPHLRPLNAALYLVVALAVVVAGSLWSYVDRPHDRYRLGEVMYGLIAVFGIVVPALFAFLGGKDAPFPSLFATMQALERRVRALAVVFSAGIAVLLVHLALYPWPAVIPDLQDLHHRAQQRHETKKERQPPVDAP